MAICGSSSKAGFGRRPVRQMSSSKSVAYSPFAHVSRYKGRLLSAETVLPVCTLASPFFLTAQHGPVHRKNVTTQRFHQGLLYPSIVSAKWIDHGTPSHSEPNISYSEPTVFENYVHDIYVDDQLVELSLWDTAGKCSDWASTSLAS